MIFDSFVSDTSIGANEIKGEERQEFREKEIEENGKRRGSGILKDEYW